MVFAHDSFFGWTNLLKRQSNAFHLHYAARPPFPIVVYNPDNAQVINNLNRSDLGFFSAIWLSGISNQPIKNIKKGSMLVYSQTKKGPGAFIAQKKYFRVNMCYIMSFAAMMGCMNSYLRLCGLVENGLRWPYPDEKLRKYIFTEKAENETIWGWIRLSNTEL